MLYTSSFFTAFALQALAVTASPRPLTPPKPCPPVKGTFDVNVFRLYTEHSDWDPINCKYYAGSLFNATVVVYDPYTKASEILTFPGISHTDPYQMSGVDFDASTGTMLFTAVSGRGWNSNGQDLSGPNAVIRYDVRTKKIVNIADLAPAQAEIQRRHGNPVAGFQDTAADRNGNAYAVVGYGGNGIVKISTTGSVSTWYSSTQELDPNKQAFTYTSIASLPAHDKLLINDNQLGTLLTFDIKAASPTPTVVKISGMPSNYTETGCDSIVFPTRYPGQQIMLCAVDRLGGSGAISVFRSLDTWKTAQYLGVAINTYPLAQRGVIVVHSVQLSNSIYYVPFFVSEDGNTASSLVLSNRTAWPLIDITAEVDNLVKLA